MVQLKGTHKCAVKILVFVLVVNEYFYNHSDHLAVDFLKRFESLDLQYKPKFYSSHSYGSMRFIVLYLEVETGWKAKKLLGPLKLK